MNLRTRAAFAILGLALITGAIHPAGAADPASGSLRAPGDSVEWSGGPFVASAPTSPAANIEPCASPGDPSCDRFSVDVAAQSGPSTLSVTVTTSDEGDDFDVYLFDPEGRFAGSSTSSGTPPGGESVAVAFPKAGAYSVRVQAWAVAPGATYRGRAALVAGDERTFDDGAADCLEAVPAKVGVAGITDDGRRVGLDVTVLLDEGVTEHRARQVMEGAAKSYAPLRIVLEAVRYLPVDIPDDGTRQKGSVTVGTASGTGVNEFAKKLFGGGRPPDSDVVYTLTNKDLYSGSSDNRDYGLLGVADCIGGVRYDDHAFAVGELGDELATTNGITTSLGNAGAKTASHEIGHLMGAHHHYFNCAEGLAEETVEERETSPCTVMAPLLRLASINFGIGDGAAVRGHAVGYAAGNDALAAQARAAAQRASAGYSLLGEDGGIFNFGDAGFFGSTGDRRLNQPVVGMAWNPTGRGYWIVARDGGIFTFGDAGFFGSMGGTRLNSPILGIEATPSGRGYWLVAGDGGIFNFGDSGFFGSTGDRRLNAPIVGLGTTSTGGGYWLVASDGGIFTFGDASFHGSTGNLRLDDPVFGIEPTRTDGGYWLVARDGGVFTFGDAPFHGSNPSAGGAPAIGLSSAVSDAGYWIADRSGRVEAFGGAPFLGDLAGRRLNAPVVGFAASP